VNITNMSALNPGRVVVPRAEYNTPLYSQVMPILYISLMNAGVTTLWGQP